MGLRGTSPDPGRRVAIEVLSGDTGDVRDIVIIGQRVPGEGFAPKDPPPPLDQIQPSSSYRNEGVLDARMGFEPCPDGSTGVTRQVIGNQVEIPLRVGAVQRLEQLQIASGIARASGLGQRLPIADAECSVYPDLL